MSLNPSVNGQSSLSSAQNSTRGVSPLPFGSTATSIGSSMDTQMPKGPIRTPFPFALSTCTPQVRPNLTSEQASKYDSLLTTVEAWTELPNTIAGTGSTGPITDEERMWLTREQLLRYLRATSWNTANAAKRLITTLSWRREYKVWTFTPEHISPENETGKQQILGYDINARPCLYLNPGKQNTDKSERQIHHLVFMLERVIDMMGPGQETTALLINFKNSSSGKSPSVMQGKQVLNILQGHYPERLGRALISDLPWYVTTFFKLISPFIDPVTKEKMIFNQDLRKFVPPAQLDKAYGGDADFEYDHKIYWPALNKMCDEKRAAYTERWIHGGKRIGEYEAYLKGGDQRPVAQMSETAATV